MAQYVSGRQPFLNVGIPGITTNTPVLDITGRVGVGITDPTADIDLNTIRIRQSISDVNNFSGGLGYFLTKDAVGLKWTNVPPDNNNALFISQNNVILGVSSYTGINFVSDGNDLVAISTNSENTKIVDVRISSRWNKDGNTGIYTSKFVGIGSTNPTVALDVIGDGKFSGIVTAVKFSGQSGIITGNVEIGSLTVTGVSTFIGVTTFSKVGIGTTTIPRTTLDVGGDVWVSGAVTALSFTAENFYGTISTSKYADVAGIATNISLASTTSTDSTSYLVLVGSTGITTQQPFIDSESLSYDGQTNTLNSDNIKVGFITATNAWIGVATINDLKVVNDTFRVGTAITMSNGIITATTFNGKFLDFESIRVSGISTFTNGTVLIGSGTSTGTSSQPLQIAGGVYVSGNLGIGTTTPNQKLWVNGNGYFTGVVTATEFKGNASTATYATDAGIATNLKGGIANNLPYQSGPSSTSFIANGTPGYYLKSNGSSLPPSWESLPVTTIDVDETQSTLTNYPLFVDATGSTSVLSINTSLFSFVPEISNPRLGIGTGSPAYNLDVNGKGRFIGTVGADIYYGNGFVGTALTISGIATVSNTFKVGTAITMNAGIITAITFVGNLTGTASTASYATTAFSLNGVNESNLNVASATTATNVISGIASVTSIFVSQTGISTLGTVKISSGIVTASSGIVTYYGDGSKLTGVSGVRVEFQELIGNPVYPTLANSAGVSSVGIATTGNNSLVFIPSSGNLGIGTTSPTAKLWVNGDGYFVGVVTSAGFYVNGELIGQGGITGENIVGTSLSISGISTLGRVKISSGIVTASSGIVTYYGDGSKLTGVSGVKVELQTLVGDPVYPTLANSAGVSSVGISTIGNTALVFIPSRGSLGIGTTLPLTPLQVERYGVKTGFGTFTASAGITTDVDSFVISINDFKTAEYTVHIQSASSIQAQKVLVMQNGTNAFSQEYGIMYEPTFMVSIGATVSGGTCKLQFTPESGISGLMTYRFTRETMI